MAKQYDSDTVKFAARGHWQSILSSLADIPAENLDGKHHPCPQCHGSDRFNADRQDFANTGKVHCSQKCGISGDGIHVLMKLNGWDFQTTLQRVGDYLVCDAFSEPPPPPVKRKRTASQQTGTSYPVALAKTAKNIRSRLPDGVTIGDKPDHAWTYQHANGSTAGANVRFTRSDGKKEDRPLSVCESGWLCKAMLEPRPLYKLPVVLDADVVYLCEGEKSAEAANTFEIASTASAGGSNAASKTDWSPLDGKQIVIIPDNDKPGRAYCDKVISLIHQQAPTATILTADLKQAWPYIPEKGDCADWGEYFDSQPPEWFREQLESIATPVEVMPCKTPNSATTAATLKSENKDAYGEIIDTYAAKPEVQEATVDSSPPSTLNPATYQSFPVDQLPDVLGSFVMQVATAIGCDPAFVVLPILSVCAAAIGTSRNLMVKRGWFVPSILWTVTIGESGSQKSPPFRIAVQPVKERQAKQAETFASEQVAYLEALSEFKREIKRWEKTQEGDRPQEPDRPTRPRSMVQDTTIEALAPILLDNSRGLLLARDELSGWISSFDQHGGKGGASADAPKWLEIYNAESITVDRKTGDERFIFVPHPSVSIGGGIQPQILSRCLTDEHKANGLQSRLLMAYPPRQAKRWRDNEISDEALSGYQNLIDELYRLKPSSDAAGKESPAVLGLNNDAKDAFRTFVNLHGEEQNALHGHLASQWSKLEEIPARLAIILHCVQQATIGVLEPFLVDGQTMLSAIAITEWFKAECLRINSLLTEPEETREARHLIAWIRNRGGKITARDLCRNRRDIPTTVEAELKLIHLASINAGEWRDIHNSREFVLFPADLPTLDA